MSDPSFSLSTRLVKSVISLMLLGGVFVTAGAWYNGRQAAWESYDRLLLGAVRDIAESTRVVNGKPVVDLPVSAFELLAQAPDDRISYAVRTVDNVLITGFADAPKLRYDPDRATAPYFYDDLMQGEAARFVELTQRFAERDFSGVVRITVGQTLRARQAMAVTLMTNALVPMAVAGLALLVTSLLVVRSAVRPLGRVADDLAQRDPYDLTPMPTENVPQEVTVILDAMNRFIGRLDRQLDTMRNLISDTAHQLRTPVAAIRVQAETLFDDPDPNRRDAALDHLLRRTRSLGVLLDQLLSRALVIHRTDSIRREALDLRDVALGILETQDFSALAPNVELELVIGEDPVFVLADEFSLIQAGRNLLSNAIKYGKGPIRVGASVHDKTAMLWVEDGGPGLPPDLAPSLGQRFSRSTASREDSAGLGLSIVTAVVAAFDGRLDLSRQDDRFRIAMVFSTSGNQA